MKLTHCLWISLCGFALGAGSIVEGQQRPFYDVGFIEKIEINFKESNWRTILQNNWRPKIYIRAEVIINGVRFPDAGVRYRGNSTYFALPPGKNDKRPFKIALDEFVQQDYQGYKTLNLNNNLYDPTLVREVMGYEFMRRFLPAPKCNYVRLTINNEDFGIFVNTQQINKDMIEEWWADEDGNRYRGQPTSILRSNDAALVWLGSQPSSYQSAYELKTEQSPNPWADLIDLCDKLNNTPANQRAQVIPTVFDVDNALRFFAVGNVALWLDSYLGRYVHNFYLYNDPTHGRFSIIPWDLNSCFGGYTDTLTVQTMKTVDPFWRENESGRPRPLFRNLVADPRLRARYLAYFRTMAREYTWAKLSARIAQLQAFIGPELQTDTKRVYSLAWFTQCVTQDIMVTSSRPLSSLKGAIDERAQFLATHPELVKVGPTLANLAHTPASPSPTTPVVVTVAVSGPTPVAVTLHHRHRGPFLEVPMFDDGQHGDGQPNDGVWGATIPPANPLAWVEYFVTANTDLGQGGAMAVIPETGGFTPNGYRVGVAPVPGGVQIHEFLAKNDSGIRDEMSDFEDWIELLNPSAQPVDVSGMYLTDNLQNPTKWRIPNGTSIPAGQTLLVWADDDPGDGPMHATFKLGAEGEAVALFATDGVTPLDAIEFGPQAADVSTGRMLGHAAVSASFPSPTPRAPNATPCGHLPYGSLDSVVDPVALSATGMPSVGGTVTVRVAGGPFSTTGILAIAVAPWQAPLPGLGSLLVDPTRGALLPVQTDAIGQVAVPLGIPNASVLRGVAFYLQAYVRRGTTGGFSNAVVTRICP